MSRPLLVLSAMLALGSLVGERTGTGPAGALLAAAAWLLGLALLGEGRRPATAALGASALAIGAAGAWVERASHDAAPLAKWLQEAGHGDTPVRVEGVAASDARDTGERWVLVVDADRVAGRAVAGRVRLQVAGEARRPQVTEGDRVQAWATLGRPRGFGDPGAFDAEGAARREGVHAVGFCKSALLVERAGAAPAVTISRIAALARRWARSQIGRAIAPGPEEGLVRAMVLGDRTGVDPATAETFRMAGTYHVLAISGAQVALLAGLLLGAARLLRLPPGPAGLAISAALVFYALFVGGEAPVARAATMTVVLLAGRSLDLDSDLANLLGLAAGLLLLVRPSAVADVAFQLSFAATLGILLLAAPLRQWLPSLPLRLDAALAVSLAAQLPLLPLLALHFHRMTPAALLLNLVAVPLSGAVLLAGLAVLLAALVLPAAAGPFGQLAWAAAHALLRSGEVARLAPALDVRVPTPGVWAVAMYVAGLALLMRPRRRLQGLVLLGLSGIGLAVGPGATGNGRLEMTVLDVGQGDSLVLRSPSGCAWVVDAGQAYGGRFDMGEAVVGPYLWSQGLRSVDRMLLTHAHPDHVGGAAFLLRAFRPREVWEGPAPRREPLYERLEVALGASGASRRAVARGIRGVWDGVEVEVLGPRVRGPGPWRTRNDDSVVLALRLGGVRFLLAGDIEARGEDALGAIPSAALKVPHHGSRSSSTPAFLAATAPAVAVVSAGFRNHFGHPHPEVLERYRARGTRVFRTDEDGAVTVATDGTRIWVRSFRDGRWQRLR